MTTRRKIGIVATALTALAVALLMIGERDPVPLFTAALVRYQPGDAGVIIQIVNRKGAPINYACWPKYPPNQISAIVQGTIAANGTLKLVVPLPFGPSSIQVGCLSRRSGAIGRRLDDWVGIDNFATNIALPPPPKTSLP